MADTAMKRGIIIMLFVACIALAAALPIKAASTNINADGNITGYGANTTTVTISLFNTSGSLVDEMSVGPGEINEDNRTYTHLAWNLTAYLVTLDCENGTEYQLRTTAQGDPAHYNVSGATNMSVTTSANDKDPNGVSSHVSVRFPFSLQGPAHGAHTLSEETFRWNLGYSTTYDASYTVHLAERDNPSNIVEQYSTDASPFTADNLSVGNYTWWVEARDSSQPHPFLQRSPPRNLTVLDQALSIDNMQPAYDSWHNTVEVNLSFTTSEPAECRLNQNNNSDFADKTPLTETGGTTHSETVYLLTEGRNHYYIQCNNTETGLVSDEYEHALRYDGQAPNASDANVTLDSGATYSLDTDLSVNWSGFTDAGSGISTYYYNISDESTTSRGISTTQTSGSYAPAQQGSVSVYVWAEDVAGNIGHAAEDSIIVDTLPPAFSDASWDNINRETTGDLEVTLTVTDSSPLSGGAPNLSYSKWDRPYTEPQPMNHVSGSIQNGETFSFTIPNEDAPDNWGNHSGEYVDFVITAADIHGRTNNYSDSEFIEDSVNPPTLEDMGDLECRQNETLRFTLEGSDPDEDELSYDCDLTGASITKNSDETANVSWQPGSEVYGDVPVTCWVTDGTYNVSESFTIQVTSVNYPPSFVSTKKQYSAYVGKTFNATFNATDPDGDRLSFSSDAEFYHISRGGTILAYPTYDDRGVHDIQLTVHDGFGGTDTMNITINTQFCGDGVCNDAYESCENCETDCGTCDVDTSKALIIYPRNCRNDTMRIRAVELVPRATCPSEGMIIDDKEVCGNLSDEKIIIDRLINDTYQKIATLVTDEEGIVTFVPEEGGRYRLRFDSGGIEEEFTSKDCISHEQNETGTATISTGDGESIEKSVEEPKEVEGPEKEESTLFVSVLSYLVIPLLAVIFVALLVHVLYKREKNQVSQGKKQRSPLVAAVDAYLIGPLVAIGRTLEGWIRKQEFLNYLYEELCAALNDLSNRLGQSYSTCRSHIISYLERKKGTLLKVPYYHAPNVNTESRMVLTILSANCFLHPWVRRMRVLNTIRTDLKGTQKPYTLVDLASASTGLNNKVTYSSSMHHAKSSQEVDKIKRAQVNGVTMSTGRYSLEQLQKLITSKRVLIAELKAKDPLRNSEMTENIVLITGYDHKNIIVHDYLNNTKHRYISNAAFLAAWKNARYRMVIIEKK